MSAKCYRYTLERDELFYVKVPLQSRYQYKGLVTAKPCDGGALIRVKPGYSFDGCTGWLDGDRRMPACLLHDAMRQCVNEDPSCPWTRKQADKALYQTLRSKRVSWIEAQIMYRAVSGPFGKIYSKIKRT